MQLKTDIRDALHFLGGCVIVAVLVVIWLFAIVQIDPPARGGETVPVGPGSYGMYTE